MSDFSGIFKVLYCHLLLDEKTHHLKHIKQEVMVRL